MNVTARLLAQCVGLASLAFTASCDAQTLHCAIVARLEQSQGGGASASAPLADAAITASQGQLLDIAFDAAGKFPEKPHIRNRSRAQEHVTSACIQLGLAHRALGWIAQIEGWRRASSYVDVAMFAAQRGGKGDAEEAERLIALALKEPPPSEDWQRDRINAKIASTYALLGRTSDSERFEAGVADAERHKSASAKAMRASPEEFDAQLAALAAIAGSGNLDMSRNALEACTQLFDRFYADTAKRDRAERTVRDAWKALPLPLRIELLMRMSRSALNSKDQAKALELVNDAAQMVAAAQWVPEELVSLRAQLAGLRFRAGDADKAREEVTQALALFDAERPRITDIDRAEALRPIADAYKVMGDDAVSLTIFKRAVEEGASNPNSRPRADDLCATCCALAVSGVEPDAALWERIRQIQQGLGSPW